MLIFLHHGEADETIKPTRTIKHPKGAKHIEIIRKIYGNKKFEIEREKQIMGGQTDIVNCRAVVQ